MEEVSVDVSAVPNKNKAPEPSFRAALRRSVAFAGGIRPLSTMTGGELAPSTINNLLKKIQVIAPHQAILVERALNGAINRLEFYPELVRQNDGVVPAIVRMLRKKKQPHSNLIVSPEEREARFAEQGFKCALCGAKKPRGKAWHADHDHDTGRFRGILCHLCNCGLGHFADDPDLLIAAITYLVRQPPPARVRTSVPKQVQ
jgi:DNA-binding transcriptional regulator YdaS (Cro superfamily)